jgi:hypothetical protein
MMDIIEDAAAGWQKRAEPDEEWLPGEEAESDE